MGVVAWVTVVQSSVLSKKEGYKKEYVAAVWFVCPWDVSVGWIEFLVYIIPILVCEGGGLVVVFHLLFRWLWVLCALASSLVPLVLIDRLCHRSRRDI